MQLEAPVRMKSSKKSMKVEEFEISAWKDDDGLMRLEICHAKGRDVFRGLNLPWESDAVGGRVTFTSNPHIIELECGTDSDDRRESPKLLREAGRDPVFRAWFMKRCGGRKRTPEQWALAIEEARRQEGRDPETGALLPPDQTQVDRLA
jgi:hypothetical protein